MSKNIIGFGKPESCEDGHCTYSVNRHPKHGHFMLANKRFNPFPYTESSALAHIEQLEGAQLGISKAELRMVISAFFQDTPILTLIVGGKVA